MHGQPIIKILPQCILKHDINISTFIAPFLHLFLIHISLSYYILLSPIKIWLVYVEDWLLYYKIPCTVYEEHRLPLSSLDHTTLRTVPQWLDIFCRFFLPFSLLKSMQFHMELL
jgi:hypothetical protein